MESHFGLIVCANQTERDTTVYAELTPSSGLICWARGRPGWRRYWPITTGRVPWEAHVRWWFEIHETGDESKEWPESAGTHWWQYDGGGTTLRQAIGRAYKAVDRALEEINRPDAEART
jgi:hypothetical protein